MKSDEKSPDRDDGNLGLEALRDFALYRIEVAPVSPPFESIKDAFEKNILRSLSPITLNIYAMNFARTVERQEVLAEIELLGKPNVIVTSAPRTAELKHRVETMLSAQIAAWNSQSEDVAGHAAKFHILDMFGRWRSALAGGSPEIITGIHALYSSILLQTWTAFETLAADLWVAALNVHPAILAALNGQPERISKKKTGSYDPAYDEERPKSKRDEASIALNLLAKEGFRIETRMGDLLRSKQRFDHLSGIRAAYSRAFSEDYDSVDKAMIDDAVDVLCALRNNLIHRGGIADRQYIEQMSYLSLPPAVEGKQVCISGTVVKSLVDSIASVSGALLVAVDDWIAAHQPVLTRRH